MPRRRGARPLGFDDTLIPVTYRLRPLPTSAGCHAATHEMALGRAMPATTMIILAPRHVIIYERSAMPPVSRRRAAA